VRKPQVVLTSAAHRCNGDLRTGKQNTNTSFEGFYPLG